MTLLVLALLGAANAAEPVVPSAGASHQVPAEEGLLLRWDPARSWGTSLLVDTLQSVARRLALELPLADPLLIGDVSQRGGGTMFGHTTHHLGVDADIGLFFGDGQQPLGGFQDLDPSRLDVAANWALLRALLDSNQVAYVLLDQGHIDRLRAYALDELGIDPEMVDGIFVPADTTLSWNTWGVVRHAPNHLSHMHVRIGGKPGT